MTDDEWVKETRRIAIAFGLPTDGGIQIHKSDQIMEDDSFSTRFPRVTYSMKIYRRDFHLSSIFCEKKFRHSISLVRDEKNRLFFVSEKNQINCHSCGDVSQILAIFIRALYCLQFDIGEIQRQLNFPISAHERLEWQLEFARRMREDACENGA